MTTNRFSPDESTRASTRGTVLLFGLLLVVAIGLSVFRGGGGDGPTAADTRAQALMACQDAVTEQLAQPATASYPLSTIRRTGLAITGTVEATNAYGVPAEITYRCTLDGTTVTAASLTS